MAEDENEAGTPATTATSATPIPNEWGIPDWQDAGAYGDVKRWNFMRWRWEFYRRRDDVREYFDVRAQSTYEKGLAFFRSSPQAFQNGRPLRPDEPAFCVPVSTQDNASIGYSPLPNPRIGAQPDLAIFPYKTDATVTPIDPTRPRSTFGDALDAAGVELSERQKWLLGDLLSAVPARLKEHELAMAFDFNLPLAAQMDASREWLAMEYRQRGKVAQKKRHRAKWLKYLRALDAREAMQSPSWRDYTDALYRRGILDRHTSASGGYCAPPPQAGRDIWSTADALRFNF